MEKSKEILKKQGVLPKLSLAVQLEGGGVKGTGPHEVKLLEDKIVKKVEYQTGKEQYFMRYIVEENGEKKYYDVPMLDKTGNVHYLVQRLAEIPEGTVVVLEYKRKGMRGYIDIKIKGEEEKFLTIDINEDEQGSDFGLEEEAFDVPVEGEI